MGEIRSDVLAFLLLDVNQSNDWSFLFNCSKHSGIWSFIQDIGDGRAYLLFDPTLHFPHHEISWIFQDLLREMQLHTVTISLSGDEIDRKFIVDLSEQPNLLGNFFTEKHNSWLTLFFQLFDWP